MRQQALDQGNGHATPNLGKQRAEEVVIKPPNFQSAAIQIVGTSPLVSHKFSAKSQTIMVETQEAGSRSRKGQKREAKDFDAAYRGAMHISKEGWQGIPCAAFRNGCISACRLAGFKMTVAKLSIFVEADGFEADGTPLVQITKGEPKPFYAPARNANGSTDIRCRPMFEPGWEALVRLTWDADQFGATDVANLMHRLGRQVGVLEGRPDSRMSSGQGWGMFKLA